MAERVTSNTLIIIFTIIIVIFSVIVLIQQVEANIAFWILRPSESTALDIVGKITALGGTTGKIKTDYRNITNEVDYWGLTDKKIICMIALKQETGALPIKTINCYSFPFNVNIPKLGEVDDGKNEFLLCLEKDYDAVNEIVKIDANWKDFTEGCD